MTNKAVEQASKILEMYLDKYGYISIFQILPISLKINRLVEKYGDSAMEHADEIINKVHRYFNDNGYKVSDLFDEQERSDKIDAEIREEERKRNDKEFDKAQKAHYGVGVWDNNSGTDAKVEPKKSCGCNKAKNNTYVADAEDKKTIKVLMPGVDKQNISIAVKDDILSVSLKDVVIETPFVNPDLEVTFYADEDWNIDEMKASLDKGILTIEIPKIKKADTTKYINIL